MPDVRDRAGDNKHVVVLPLKQMSESVTVGQDARQARVDRRPSLGTALTREQIDALSDDPDELQRQLSDMAGPDATIRVDSFEGSELPPKAQIKSIHITRDQFAAENHCIGGLFIDIITQPGIGPLRGNGNLQLQRQSAEQRRPRSSPTKAVRAEPQLRLRHGRHADQAQKRRFSINFNGQDSYTQPNLFIVHADGTQTETLQLHVPRRQASVQRHVELRDHARIRRSALRRSSAATARTTSASAANDLADRAYSSAGSNRHRSTCRKSGRIGRRFFLNTRG